LFNSDTSDIESNVVTGDGLSETLMMHFDRFNFRSQIGWDEFDNHSWFKDTGFNSSYWDSSDTSNFVDILEWKSEWFIHGSLGGFEFIESLVKSLTFVPRHVFGFLDHVITVPSRNGDELDLFEFVTNFLEVGSDFFFDFVESSLFVVDNVGVHLVDTDDHLLNTKSVGKKGMFSGLSVF